MAAVAASSAALAEATAETTAAEEMETQKKAKPPLPKVDARPLQSLPLPLRPVTPQPIEGGGCRGGNGHAAALAREVVARSLAVGAGRASPPSPGRQLLPTSPGRGYSPPSPARQYSPPSPHRQASPQSAGRQAEEHDGDSTISWPALDSEFNASQGESDMRSAAGSLSLSVSQVTTPSSSLLARSVCDAETRPSSHGSDPAATNDENVQDGASSVDATHAGENLTTGLHENGSRPHEGGLRGSDQAVDETISVRVHAAMSVSTQQATPAAFDVPVSDKTILTTTLVASASPSQCAHEEARDTVKIVDVVEQHCEVRDGHATSKTNVEGNTGEQTASGTLPCIAQFGKSRGYEKGAAETIAESHESRRLEDASCEKDELHVDVSPEKIQELDVTDERTKDCPSAIKPRGVVRTGKEAIDESCPCSVDLTRTDAEFSTRNPSARDALEVHAVVRSIAENYFSAAKTEMITGSWPNEDCDDDDVVEAEKHDKVGSLRAFSSSRDEREFLSAISEEDHGVVIGPEVHPPIEVSRTVKSPEVSTECKASTRNASFEEAIEGEGHRCMPKSIASVEPSDASTRVCQPNGDDTKGSHGVAAVECPPLVAQRSPVPPEHEAPRAADPQTSQAKPREARSLGTPTHDTASAVIGSSLGPNVGEERNNKDLCPLLARVEFLQRQMQLTRLQTAEAVCRTDEVIAASRAAEGRRQETTTAFKSHCLLSRIPPPVPEEPPPCSGKAPLTRLSGKAQPPLQTGGSAVLVSSAVAPVVAPLQVEQQRQKLPSFAPPTKTMAARCKNEAPIVAPPPHPPPLRRPRTAAGTMSTRKKEPRSLRPMSASNMAVHHVSWTRDLAQTARAAVFSAPATEASSMSQRAHSYQNQRSPSATSMLECNTRRSTPEDDYMEYMMSSSPLSSRSIKQNPLQPNPGSVPPAQSAFHLPEAATIASAMPARVGSPVGAGLVPRAQSPSLGCAIGGPYGSFDGTIFSTNASEASAPTCLSNVAAAISLSVTQAAAGSAADAVALLRSLPDAGLEIAPKSQTPSTSLNHQLSPEWRPVSPSCMANSVEDNEEQIAGIHSVPPLSMKSCCFSNEELQKENEQLRKQCDALRAKVSSTRSGNHSAAGVPEATLRSSMMAIDGTSTFWWK
eukprot:TRINITY_DN25908_c0_g1_i1.p1 TRINITY_DN25908_c0_g1~~TRINITY_DN25908_c0_g1_i1.p1  ORF type:complete len:1140 (-),score=183.41 TRINITY_DN25908_c0_g1_i1:344-3763(-)